MEMRAAALRAAFRHLVRNYNFTAIIAVVRGNPMSPPQLTGNAPVADILHPVQIDLGIALRIELKLTGLDRFDRGLGKLVHLDEPLRLDHRLDRRMAAVMRTDVVLMRLHTDQKPLFLQILNDQLTCLVTVHAGVFAAVLADRSVIVQDADLLQIVAQAHFKVVRVMRGRDLHGASPEFLVDIIILDHRDLTADKRQDQHFADTVLITLVLRIDRNGRIAEQRLGTGGRDLDISAAVLVRVTDMPEKARLILVLDLCV